MLCVFIYVRKSEVDRCKGCNNMNKGELNSKELNQIICENTAMFLCGNGFSINFDKDFSNIYDRLFEAHKSLMRNGKYEANGGSLLLNF